MGTVDNLLLSTAKSLTIFDISPNTQQLSSFLPKTKSALEKKGVTWTALENSLDSTTEKVYCRQIPLRQPCPHSCWPLFAFPQCLEAGCRDREEFARLWAPSVTYLKNLLRETVNYLLGERWSKQYAEITKSWIFEYLLAALTLCTAVSNAVFPHLAVFHVLFLRRFSWGKVVFLWTGS